MQITNCRFLTSYTNFSSSKNGGALFIFYDSPKCIDIFKCNFSKCNVNKEGGAFYSEATQNSKDLNMKYCIFNECISYSGGGSISISTKYSSIINECIFNSNKAKNGKGGAIYIGSSSDSTGIKLYELDSLMINKCNFTSNNRLDGFAICIEGNNNESKINITENIFIDNYNKITMKESFIISLEICCISYQEIITNNYFSNKENGIEIKVYKFSCFGIPNITFSKIFTESFAFSKSNIFTQTFPFSKSQIFSETAKFKPFTIIKYSSSIEFIETKSSFEKESLELEPTEKIEESTSN